MKLEKIHHYSTVNDDIYILEKFHSYILINSDKRLILLNDALQPVQTVISSELPSIYGVYKHFDRYECLLYDPNEETNQIFLYVRFHDNHVQLIKIPDYIPSLSSVYWWKDDFIIFMSYEMFFYCIDFKRRNLQLAVYPEYMVKTYFSDFYSFCYKSRKHRPLENVNSIQGNFIYKAKKYMVYYDFCNNKRVYINYKDESYHDVMYYQNIFVFIAEERLTLVCNSSVYSIEVPNKYYIFVRACFINLFLVTLLCNTSNPRISDIISYQVVI